MSPHRLEIATTRDRPDLVPVVAAWQRAEFNSLGALPLATLIADIARPTPAVGPTQYFVLLEDGVAVGTATLDDADLDERPDLTPWLANVVVDPAARGRGLAAHLIAAVERAARDAGFPVLWLWTTTAERIYARAGWIRVERVPRAGRTAATLMRRDL